MPAIYTSLLEGLPIAAGIFTQKGKIIATNHALLDRFKRPLSLGAPSAMADLFDAASHEKLLHGVLLAVGGQPSECIGVFSSLDGVPVAGEATFNPLPLPGVDEAFVLMQLRDAAADDYAETQFAFSSKGFPDQLISFSRDETPALCCRKLVSVTGQQVPQDQLEQVMESIRQGDTRTFYLRQDGVDHAPDRGCLCTEVRLFPGEGGGRCPVWAAVRPDVPCPQEIEENRRLAYQDGLTGLANRRAFLSGLEQQLDEKALEGNSLLAVLCIDLDEFKKVNDLGGHAAGDEMLQLVARCLDRLVVKCGQAARIGGDEFAAYAWVETEADAIELAQSICEGLSEIALTRGERIFTVGGSVGVSLLGENTEAASVEVPDLLHHADSICLRGKHNGGGNTALEWFRKVPQLPSMDGAPAAVPPQLSDLAMVPDFIDLKLEDLELHAMPIVRLADLRPVGLEVLLRRREEDLGQTSPRRLLAMADRRGWLAQVDTWIMDQVIDTATAGGERSMVGVNVSAAAASSEGLRDLLQARLQGNPLLAGRLCIEVSERDLLREPDLMVSFLQQVTELGFQTALDDFSGHWSSMDRLIGLRFSWVKLNPSLTKAALGQRRKLVLLRCMVGALHELGVKVVAKHVETLQELEALKEIGVWGGQGYHIGHPSPWTGGFELRQG
ncbi:EAL domain-containing protein [Roseibium sp. CAU 1637]|uniref:EAL domain-containing protein n=1 Tax=Roseibium limicola TaxID=2816037 RepID=A0A939ESM6_9HYPH|nr:GGDEF domain-containing phosphodiesterase [Roseibium limicola]MBO0346384.1 EAL domain-containing protein [Roseibium limicola]